MEVQENVVNKVAMSGLVTFDLASLAPREEPVVYDISDHLYQGLILREKDFREVVKSHDWSQYAGKNVAVTCSTDAIIPTWAYMLLANKLEPYVNILVFGSSSDLELLHYERMISGLDMEPFRDQRVVVKGCGDIRIPESAFVLFTVRLSQVAKSIMYGEPCSTVPIFKRKS